MRGSGVLATEPVMNKWHVMSLVAGVFFALVELFALGAVLRWWRQRRAR